MLGYTKGMADPLDGRLRREADGVTPNGVIEEAPVLDLVNQLTTDLDIHYLQNLLHEGVKVYAENGFTTA